MTRFALLIAILLISLPLLAGAEWFLEEDAGVPTNIAGVGIAPDGNHVLITEVGSVYLLTPAGWILVEEIFSFDLMDVSFGSDGYGSITVAQGGALVTWDSGETWEVAMSFEDIINYAGLTLPGTTTSVMVGSTAEFEPAGSYSHDGWETWTDFVVEMEQDGTLYDVALASGNRLVAAYASATGGAVMRSDPTWESWEPVLETVVNVTKVAMSPEGMNGVAITTDGDIYITEDGAASWELVLEDRVGIRAVAFRDEEHVTITGDNGLLMESLDGGHNWYLVPVRVNDDEYLENDLYAVAFDTDGVYGMIGGDSGTLLRHALPTYPVELKFFPQNTFRIPAPGQTMTYMAYLRYDLAQEIPGLRFWTKVELPNGNELGPLVNVPVDISPGEEVAVYGLELDVPSFAPPGMYWHKAYFGRMPVGMNILRRYPFSKYVINTATDGPTDWRATTPTQSQVVRFR